MATKTMRLIPDRVLERSAEIMRVLAHPARLRICELLEDGELSVGELVELTGLAQNAVSQHLSVMRAQGVLGRRRDGKTVYYSVVHPSARWMLGCIRRHGEKKARRHEGT
jgi:DNA-binding transcriptional ArsR family regulator